MQKLLRFLGVAVLASAAFSQLAYAQLSGAIFTTVSNGSEVNFNIYANKTDVYLDGGPGPGAPQGAAGLPDGDYIFMVTDPSGKTLLSTDIAACRHFQVANGIITNLVATGCASQHVTGTDVDHGALTIQLYPFADTPNHGNEYKAWATPASNYQCSLAVVDCGSGTHGFINRYSKTDNFKVKMSTVVEIDTRFLDENNGGAFIDGMGITWIDTLGNSNNKWSYFNQALDVNHEAHVESPEPGTHQIVIQPQAGCSQVGAIYVSGQQLPNLGPQTVNVKITQGLKNATIFVDVECN